MRTFRLTCIISIAMSLSPSAIIQALEKTPIVAASDGVEISEIQIERRSSLSTGSDSHLDLKLWFTSNWPQDAHHALVHIQSLEPIVDDTGYVLTTDKRREDIFYLQGEVRGPTWAQVDGQSGAEVTLRLDAPAHGARKIKAIRGTAWIAAAKPVELIFNDLAAINGKDLEHSKLKELKQMKLRFNIRNEDEMLKVSIASPLNYASPSKFGRLEENWFIVNGEKPLHETSLSTVPRSDSSEPGVVVERTFASRKLQGLSLRIYVQQPANTKTFKFEFANVPLP